jgi:hypothetical protein
VPGVLEIISPGDAVSDAGDPDRGRRAAADQREGEGEAGKAESERR